MGWTIYFRLGYNKFWWIIGILEKMLIVGKLYCWGCIRVQGCILDIALNTSSGGKSRAIGESRNKNLE